MPAFYKLSVIICTYNRANLLQGALKSLDEQFLNKATYQIIVVDDGSTDNTEEVVKRNNLTANIDYLRVSHAGRAVARNHGIKEAQGDYVLFVDDDILAPPNLLEEHVNFHKKHNRAVVRGPIINVREYEIPLDRSSTWRDYSTAFFCTCNASCSKYALIQAGGFDEAFTEYGFEDNELGWRLREKGLKMQFNKDAIVYHYKPVGHEELSEMVQRAEELGRSAVAYYTKHPHWQVGLATGLHPLLRPWNALLSNGWLYSYYKRQWEDRADELSPDARAKLERRIFTYHYLRSLEAERQRVALEGLTQATPPPAGAARQQREERPLNRESKLGRKNLRADVHVQSKEPPGKGSQRSF